MAVEQITRIVDDLDQKSTATRQIMVGLEGTWAVLDVSDANYDKIIAAVGKFTECGRARNQKPTVIKKVIGSNGDVATEVAATEDGAAGVPGLTAPELRAKVREWAATKNIRVSPRGKIADQVMADFLADHPELAPAA